MAHFHRLASGERVSGRPIDVTGSSISLGLWGYRDSSQRELRVVPAGQGVTADARRVLGQSREWVITSNVSSRVRVEARTVEGQVWDWVELSFLAPSAHAAAQRRAVIAEAQLHVGSHYLWGSAGARPGLHDGMVGKSGGVLRVDDRVTTQNPCLRAVSYEVQAGRHICAGRYAAVGGRVIPPNDAALARYLEGLRGQNPAQWQPLDGLWPRMMDGPTVTRQIVLGESCLGMRHFDCVGFINYCFAAVLRRSVQNTIGAWITRTTEVTDGSDQPADVLTRGFDHIGFSMGDGRVIQAAEASRGVVITLLASERWSRRGRFLN